MLFWILNTDKVWIVWVLKSAPLSFTGHRGQTNVFLKERCCFCFLPALYGCTGALLRLCIDLFSITYSTWNTSSWDNSTFSHTEFWIFYSPSCWYTYIIVINAINNRNQGTWLCDYIDLKLYTWFNVQIFVNFLDLLINNLYIFPLTVRTFWSIL